MLPVLLAATALAWPAPCADPVLCRQEWDALVGATRYEIAADGVKCAEVRQTCQRGVCQPPRTWYWPNLRCGPTDRPVQMTFRACNSHGCREWSEPVEFQPIPWRCFNSTGEVPCG